MEKLKIAAERKLFFDATKSFSFRFHERVGVDQSNPANDKDARTIAPS
jgi:hypothetical protein